MQHGVSRLIVAAFAVGSVLGSAVSAIGEEVYTATLIVPDATGVGGREAELKLTIKEFTSEDEAAELRKLLEDEGSDAVFAKLKTWDRGLAEIQGSASQKILHVRVIPGENGNRVMLVTEGQLYMPDRSQDPRYQNALGFVQLDVGTRGVGTGVAAAVEGVQLSRSGTLEMRAHMNQQLRLKDVTRQ